MASLQPPATHLPHLRGAAVLRRVARSPRGWQAGPAPERLLVRKYPDQQTAWTVAGPQDLLAVRTRCRPGALPPSLPPQRGKGWRQPCPRSSPFAFGNQGARPTTAPPPGAPGRASGGAGLPEVIPAASFLLLAGPAPACHQPDPEDDCSGYCKAGNQCNESPGASVRKACRRINVRALVPAPGSRPRQWRCPCRSRRLSSVSTRPIGHCSGRACGGSRRRAFRGC